MFQTDHHNQVMELCSCSKDNQFKFSFSHSFRGDQYLPLHLLHASLSGTFTLQNNETDTNKMGTESSGNLLVSVNVQYEHIHTILYKPLFICLSV